MSTHQPGAVPLAFGIVVVEGVQIAVVAAAGENVAGRIRRAAVANEGGRGYYVSAYDGPSLRRLLELPRGTLSLEEVLALLHADQHGVLVIPPEIAHDVIAVAAEIEQLERKIISYCQSPEFTLAGLKPLFRETRAKIEGK